MCDGVMPPATCTGSYIPRNVTGVADGGGSGGGDTMITLGPFAGHRGTGATIPKAPRSCTNWDTPYGSGMARSSSPAE